MSAVSTTAFYLFVLPFAALQMPKNGAGIGLTLHGGQLVCEYSLSQKVRVYILQFCEYVCSVSLTVKCETNKKTLISSVSNAASVTIGLQTSQAKCTFYVLSCVTPDENITYTNFYLPDEFNPSRKYNNHAK